MGIVMNKGWYVVHTLSGQELKVKETLESRIISDGFQDSIFQVLVPTESVSEVKSGKKRVIERKIFPGYILVEMELDDTNWYFIKDIPGVIGFIGSGKPMPLLDEEVQEIFFSSVLASDKNCGIFPIPFIFSSQ